MTNHHTTQNWGDALPNDVLAEAPSVRGTRLADGRIECGCGYKQEDNSSPGLKPSCSSCWSAIEVEPRR